MLLPLAFLLRVAPEPAEHRLWLETILDHLLADAVPAAPPANPWVRPGSADIPGRDRTTTPARVKRR